MPTLSPVPDMTYNVFSGTLNPTQSINQSTYTVEAPSVNIVLRYDQISYCLIKMFCIILKHHFREPELEVIHCVTISFRCEHRGKCTHTITTNTIRYSAMFGRQLCKPGIERVQTLADISCLALCLLQQRNPCTGCKSTGHPTGHNYRAPATIPPSYIRVRAVV